MIILLINIASSFFMRKVYSFVVFVLSVNLLVCALLCANDVEEREDSQISLAASTLPFAVLTREEIIERLTQDMDSDSQINVRVKLRLMPVSQLTPEFGAMANRLAHGISGPEKGSLMETLSLMPTERLTPEFEAMVNRRTHGMNATEKRKEISELLHCLNDVADQQQPQQQGLNLRLYSDIFALYSFVKNHAVSAVEKDWFGIQKQLDLIEAKKLARQSSNDHG